MMHKPRPALQQLFRPQSLVLIGASDRNPYSSLLQENLQGIQFDGRIYVVNRRGVAALGHPGVTSCAAIGEPVDAGIVLAPGEAVLDVVTDAVAGGIRNLVIVSSGFSEVGASGQSRQERLLKYCSEHGVNVLGPNCLGYQNHADRVALGAIPFIRQKREGSLAIISASGAISTYMAQCAAQQGLPLSHVIAVGNEMNVTTADVLDMLIDDPRVKAFSVFIEGIRNPDDFARVAERARAARKPIVAIKVGASEASAVVAAAHTGALVGDDRVFDAVCDKYGIVRTSSVEACLATAGTIISVGAVARPGIAFISISGGKCGIVSDLCAAHHVPLPSFSAKTKTALEAVVSDFGQTLNPLDLTGRANGNFSLWSDIPRAVSADPRVGLTVVNMELPSRSTPYMAESLPHVGNAARTCHTPVLLMTNIAIPVNEYGETFLSQYGIGFAAPGVDLGIQAVGKLIWWSERVRRMLDAPPRPTVVREGGRRTRPASEHDVLTHLAGFGVPVISADLTKSPDEAVTAARRIGGPVVLKIVSADIPHKTEVGGVKLNLEGEPAVRQAYGQLIASVVAARPNALIEGVSVSPLRSGGVEILVGIARDPQWGLVMAVGLGGVWVEALRDTALILFPVSADEIIRALESLRGSKLLKGFRGASPVNLRAVADVAVRIAEAALALGPDLEALEVNPLFAQGDHIEALDALAVWKSSKT